MKAKGIGAFRIIWVLAVLFSLSQWSLAGNIQYTYDTANRLITADYGGGKSITFTYDNNGNLLQRDVQVIGPTTYTLTVGVSPVAGGSVTGNGINCPGDCTQAYDQNTNVQLTANPAAGMKFLGWEGALVGTANPNTVTMNGDKQTIGFFGAQSGNTDTDGVPDGTESGPNGDNPSYDGNGNGIPDYQEPGAVSLPSASGGAYVTLAVPDGSGQSLTNVQATGNPSPGGSPAGVQFPYGFFQFRVMNLASGACTTVTLHLPGTTAVNTYYKYGPTPDDPSDHWYEFMYDGRTGAEMFYAGGQIRVVLHLCDGERGDNDLTANGQIDEPGGPGIRQPPIPTLSEWGMILLILLMLLGGFLILRQRDHGPAASA